MIKFRILAIGWLLLASFMAFSEEESAPKLSYSFFGIGMERPHYQETSSDFGGESFFSDFKSDGLMQVSGGFTQIDPEWGFSIITSSTLIANETQEDWDFKGFGVIQQDQMTLSQNGLDIQLTYLPLPKGQYLTGGMRYQKISFSRFAFTGTGNISQLNDAIFTALESDASSEYSVLKAHIESYGGDASLGIPHPTEGGILKDDDGELITNTAELREAVELNPNKKQGVVFEDATSIMASFGYGIDSYFDHQGEGLRYRAGIQLGLPLYLSVLNTDNNKTISEALPSGYDVNLHVGIGYQISKQVGLILQYQYLVSQRDEIVEAANQVGVDDVRLPENEYTSSAVITEFFWAF